MEGQHHNLHHTRNHLNDTITYPEYDPITIYSTISILVLYFNVHK